MGDFFPAALSPAIWWKWLQNKIVAVVKPIVTEAAAAQWLTKALVEVWPATCSKDQRRPFSGSKTSFN